jgi:hypothetical protein
VRALRAELSKEQAGPHLQCRSSASQQLRGGCRGMAKMPLTARAHRPSQTFLAAMRARWGHPWQPWELLRAAASAAAVAASSLRCLKPNVVRTLVLDEKHTHSLPVSSHTLRLLNEGSSTQEQSHYCRSRCSPCGSTEVDHDLRVQSDLCANLPMPGACRGPGGRL